MADKQNEDMVMTRGEVVNEAFAFLKMTWENVSASAAQRVADLCAK